MFSLFNTLYILYWISAKKEVLAKPLLLYLLLIKKQFRERITASYEGRAVGLVSHHKPGDIV